MDIDHKLLNKALHTVVREGSRRQSRRAFRVMMFLLILAFIALSIVAHHARSEPRCSRQHQCSVQEYLAPILDNLDFWIKNDYARRVELQICAHPHLPADLPRMRNCKIAQQAERIAGGAN